MEIEYQKIRLDLVLIGIFVIGIGLTPFSYGDDIFIDVRTDKITYSEGEIIVISGTVSEQSENYIISMQIENPSGNIVSIDQIQPQQGIFQTEFVAGGGAWQQDGTYAVTVRYGPDAVATATFEFANESQIKITVNTTKPVYDSSELVKVFGTVFPYVEGQNMYVAWLLPNGTSIGESYVTHLPSENNQGDFTFEIWNRIFEDVQGDYKAVVKYKDAIESITFLIRKDTSNLIPTPQIPTDLSSSQESGIIISSDKHVYKMGDQITLTGLVDPTIKSEIAISIINPKDNTVFVSQLKPSGSGGFSQTVETQGPLWGYEGTYTIFVTFGDDVSQSRFVLREPVSIPDWVRTNAQWWSEDQISDDEFTKGIEFLIKEDIVKIKEIPEIQSNDKNIPEWVKTNAGWWSQGLISDEDFAKGIEFLVEQGIIKI